MTDAGVWERSLQPPEAKYIFARPPSKTAEFEVKNRHESVEKTKPKHLLVLLLLFFEILKYV